MSLLFSSHKDCFCAFCKSERRVYLKRNIGWLDTLGSLMGALAVTFAIFQELDPRGIFIFLGFAMLGEIFVKLRWRMSMTCRHCGFDPLLYVKDKELASQKVKAFLNKRKEDPSMLLRPPLNLPKITKEQADQLRREELESKRGTGKIISRQI